MDSAVQLKVNSPAVAVLQSWDLTSQPYDKYHRTITSED